MPTVTLRYMSTGELCHLGDVVGCGGQKHVYSCDVAGHVVGIMDTPDPDYADRTFKLLAWPVAIAAQEFHAFPVDRVVDGLGTVVGIVMPQRHGKKLTELLSPLTRGKEADDLFILKVFENLTIAINAAHTAGYLIGDLNPENVLFNNQGKVSILDCDSFYHNVGNVVFTTTVGVAEFLPPELQKHHRDGSLGTTKRTLGGDSFAFATLLFTTVMDGNHPFANQDCVPIPQMIETGRWPHNQAVTPRPRKACPQLSDLPDSLAKLFRKTFDNGLFAPSQRPSMMEWNSVLKVLRIEAESFGQPSTKPSASSQQAGQASPGATAGKPHASAGPSRPQTASTAGAVSKPRDWYSIVIVSLCAWLTASIAVGWFIQPSAPQSGEKDAPRIWTDLMSVKTNSEQGEDNVADAPSNNR